MNIKSKGIAFWTKHISEWKDSGLSQAQYCRTNNLKVKTFSNWKRKVFSQKDTIDNTGFIEIPLSEVKSNSVKLELSIDSNGKINICFTP